MIRVKQHTRQINYISRIKELDSQTLKKYVKTIELIEKGGSESRINELDIRRRNLHLHMLRQLFPYAQNVRSSASEQSPEWNEALRQFARYVERKTSIAQTNFWIWEKARVRSGY